MTLMIQKIIQYIGGQVSNRLDVLRV